MAKANKAKANKAKAKRLSAEKAKKLSDAMRAKMFRLSRERVVTCAAKAASELNDAALLIRAASAVKLDRGTVLLVTFQSAERHGIAPKQFWNSVCEQNRWSFEDDVQDTGAQKRVPVAGAKPSSTLATYASKLIKVAESAPDDFNQARSMNDVIRTYNALSNKSARGRKPSFERARRIVEKLTGDDLARMFIFVRDLNAKAQARIPAPKASKAQARKAA